MKTVSDADLLGSLRAADPAAMIALPPAAALAAVRHVRPSRAPRRRWAVWAAVLTVVVVGVPAGAVASGYAARTGWFGSPNAVDDPNGLVSTESDDTEWLDLGAGDLPEVITSLYPEWMPLAPGVTTENLTARVTEAMTRSDALAQETLVRRTYEYESYKDWIGAWIAAHDRGDQSGQMAAAEVLTHAADWPAMIATDGGGITDIMRAFAERIAAGDDDAAQALAQVEGAPAWDGVSRSDLITQIYDSVLGAQE